MSNLQFQPVDRSQYSVYDLYATGLRMVDDFEPEDAVRKFMKLHPNADETAVREELQEAIARQDG